MYRLRLALAGFFLVFLVLFTVNAIDVSATAIEREKKEKTELEEKKRLEEKRLKGLKAERGSIEEEIKLLDLEAEEIVVKLQDLGEKIHNNKKNIKDLEGKIQEAESTKNKHYDTMKRRIKYMYENGDSGYLDLFLGSKSIEDILNKAEYVTEIADYDNSLLDHYLLAKLTVETKRDEKATELKDLETNKALADNELLKNQAVAKEKDIRFKKYSALIKESGDIISRFSGEIIEKEAHIDQLIAAEEKKRKEREERERKERERQRLLAEKEKKKVEEPKQQPKRRQTGYLWPLPGYARISSGFGRRGVIIKGGGTFHNGIDIPAPIGSTIVAALDGTVASAGYNYSMGNYVLISHGDGLYTVYMHASRLLTQSGVYVSQGQKIALVGSTGFSTGPHLHFGVKINGVYQNPSNYVSP